MGGRLGPRWVEGGRGGLWRWVRAHMASHEAHLGDDGAHLLTRIVLRLVAQWVVVFKLRTGRQGARGGIAGGRVEEPYASVRFTLDGCVLGSQSARAGPRARWWHAKRGLPCTRSKNKRARGRAAVTPEGRVILGLELYRTRCVLVNWLECLVETLDRRIVGVPEAPWI